MSWMSRLLTAALLASALAACGGDDAAEPDAGYNCEVEQRDEEFVAGMSKTGELGIQFTLVSSNPAPPARNDNTWILELHDSGGAPLEGATVDAKPFMPDHNHGTSIDVEVTPVDGMPGQYQLAPVNMFMPGVWETTIRATPAGGSQAERDSVVFTFCISS
jgi:hypothetical protein